MALSAQLLTQLSDGLSNVSTVGVMGLLIFVALFVFKKMRAAFAPETINRHGQTYELDKTYKKKLPKYAYFEGQRYVLKEPEDKDEPYELDEEQPYTDDCEDSFESIRDEWESDERNSHRAL